MDYTSTLSIGTGWVRVKGLDVFNAIKSEYSVDFILISAGSLVYLTLIADLFT